MTNAPGHLPEAHVLVSAALFLMTKHAQSRCPALCPAIAQQFAWLARHPAGDIPAPQRSLYRRLAEQWAEMARAGPLRGHTLVAGAATYLQ